MRGDETQLNSTGGEVFRGRSGPRHAAPRKSLLTKLHIPAGKAFALAAMPTAVFVGMGLTPKLALADDATDIPFAPGPCVTRSDEPSESPEPSASATKSPSPSASETTGDSGSGSDQGDGATPKPSATSSASGTSNSSGDASATTPSTSPSPTATQNPLDPLGVGDALKGLLGGSDQGTASPSPSATTASPKPSDTAAKSTDNPVDKVTDTVGKTADAIRDAADKAGTTVEELDDGVKGLDPVKDVDIPDGAKERFPCPTADPKALAAADLEQGIPRLPNQPWILESSLLTLSGLDYKGIVEVEKGDGTTKKVLKFTASSVDIKDLHQLTEGPNGTTGHVQARKGSTSTIRNGTVTMYTEELKGNLFGLIPITFSPQTPPPVNVPFAFFTNVKVTQAGQFGGTLTVPGLHNYFTGGNS
ncbi:hypothetical protein OHA59_29230 [Streptomyces sp. NBC_01589]|uniref:hypothetical protein n=1 Tax=Streptomyces sp. NBC_01589 TaxID=2975886 RepID=UPI0038667159